MDTRRTRRLLYGKDLTMTLIEAFITGKNASQGSEITYNAKSGQAIFLTEEQ